MRVTVCFGQTRVIVPCKGGATVADLVKEACVRYKKAIGKGPKYYVRIKQLVNGVDDGILDVDDYVYDVVEDRDKLIAIFEEEDQSYRYNGWDHASVGSGSDGHRSPQPSFQRQISENRFGDDKSTGTRSRSKAPTGNATVIKHEKRNSDLEVNVGADALKSGSSSNIVVRDSTAVKNGDQAKSPIKKNSGFSQYYYGRRESGSGQEEDSHLSRKFEKMLSAVDSPGKNTSSLTANSDTNLSVDSGHHSVKNKLSYTEKNYGNFVRGLSRQSIMGMLSESYDEYNNFRPPPDGGKQNSFDLDDPNGSYSSGYRTEHYLPPPPDDPSMYPRFYNDCQEMFVDIDKRPLGIKVTSYREKKVFLGLLVESVDKDGRSEREGLLQQGDVIVEITNYILAQYTLTIAQEIFKDAMKFPELQLRVYTIEERERASAIERSTVENNNAFNKHRHTPSIPVLSVIEPTPPKASKISAAKSLPDLNASFTTKASQDASLAGKLPLVARMSLDTLSNNTRKIGNMFEIELRKGDQGLGFSITTRDTPVGDPGPIYIKNILPKGAAIQDGRLHAGDRLLKVNDIELTGHTQESAVNILRCIDVGSIVSLVVSRHINTLPRKMKDDPVTDKVLSDESNREYFKFEIALNDTGSAGLGISLKGNQSKKTKKDLGIFVKSVFHGGAAYQDGRLQPNDQLVSVNGQPLIGMTNHEAIDTLRTSMSTVGNVRGMIQMEIARRKPKTGGDPTSPRFSSEASSEISDSIVNDRSSRTSEDRYHQRQNSTPSLLERTLSPIRNLKYRSVSEARHSRQFSDLSLGSSIFSTSMGNDTSFPESEDVEIQRYMGNNLQRSSAVISPVHSATKPLRRHSSLRTTNKEQYTFAETINRYTQSTSSPTSPQYKNVIGDLIWNAAIDNHYKPKRLTQRSTATTVSRITMPAGRNGDYVHQKPPARSSSLKGFKHKDNFHNGFLTSRPTPTSRVVRSSTSGYSERSAFDNMTAFEITGTSQSENYNEDSFRYSNDILQQLDPNLHEESYNGTSNFNGGDWSPSPEPQDEEVDPFSRESIFRQSVSEKRKGAASRDAQSTDMFKAIKNKQISSEIVHKKEPSIETKPSTPLKWVKPTGTKSSHSANSTPSTQTPRKSPSSARRNLNNSSNFPARTNNRHTYEPDVEVGPTLGIAKSSSLESLQTAVENFVDKEENGYLKTQPRVLRGRVLNESFRAALDQSYDMDNLAGRPMATQGSGVSPLVKSNDGNPTAGPRTHEKKRAGKSYKIFGIFRVGKNKRSLSSDRNLDSNSSTSSSPRLTESATHKKLLEAKREDDYRKHQEETERIQAKAKAMREQQEQRRREEENRYRSREDLVDSSDDRTRAPSVPVTAMQRIDLDSKDSFSEVSSGRRSGEPASSRQLQPQTFEWHTSKRPTSPVNYAERGRHKRPEKKPSGSKTKLNPDYSSLPRKPRLEPDAGRIQDGTNRAVTTRNSQAGLPTSLSYQVPPPQPTLTQYRNAGQNGNGISNHDFYNMQKPPGSKKRPTESKATDKFTTKGHVSESQRQGRSDKPKAGRTLYYDDADDSPQPSTFRSKTPQPYPRSNKDVSPKPRPVSTTPYNGLGFSPDHANFHREDSPEPPPVVLRNHRQQNTGSSTYRHTVHLDTPSSKRETHQPSSARSRSQLHHPSTNFKWKTQRPKRHDHDYNEPLRTDSPSSTSSAAERNRDAVKKILHQTRYRDHRGTENIVISPPYNL